MTGTTTYQYSVVKATCDRLAFAERNFMGSKYEAQVKEATNAYCAQDYSKVEQILAKLPNEEKLLKGLLEILNGKPAYATLKRLSEGRVVDKYEQLKAYFSLGTHVAIECEKGNTEYKMILESLYGKIGRVLYVGRE